MLCHVLRLGLRPYDEAWEIQRCLCLKRLKEEVPDALLLVEHPPTITVGKSGKTANILASGEELDRRGVSLFFTDRGGDVTYHGPGQLVIYPIVDLRQRGRDIHAFVHDLEEVVIRTLAGFCISGTRNAHAGVWVENRQIAAIGIAVRRWVTMHGIALNVSPDPTHFGLINPCGTAGTPVTSVCELARQDGSSDTVTDGVMGAVADGVVAEFAAVFGAFMEETTAEGKLM